MRQLPQDLSQPILNGGIAAHEIVDDGTKGGAGMLMGATLKRYVVELCADIGFDGQRRIVTPDFQDVGQGVAQRQARNTKPNRVDVRTKQVFVCQIQSRRRNGTSHHFARALEEVLIVRAAG